MSLLELVKEMGLEPLKTSMSRGGEYHCPCPHCGGKDRFMFWPETNRGVDLCRSLALIGSYWPIRKV